MWAVHLPWTVSAAGCGCISPRRQGLIRVCGTRQAMSRDPPQRRRARARNGVAPYIPAAFCRDARSAGHGATRAARPFRSLQAGGFASGMDARQGGESSAGSVHDSPPRQGDARESHKQERNGKKKRKKNNNNNRHGNHRKEYSGHITNRKGNGRRVSVARFPSCYAYTFAPFVTVITHPWVNHVERL